MSNYAIARANMVDGQLRPNRVTDSSLIEALKCVPRELFVPKVARGVAYVDEDLAIGGGRYLVEPLVFARMLQEVGITPQDVVLDIGCATGYSSAVLARLATTVVALDSEAELVARAGELFNELGIDNALAITADMTQGYPDQAPYDVIIINGATAEVPPCILDQLAEGGRLVAVVAPNGGMGTATLFKRIGGVTSGRALFDAATHPLPGFEAKRRFVF